MNFWSVVSRVILKGRIPILIILGIITYFLATQMQYMRFSHSEANLLPKNHEVNQEYDKFLEIFGEEGNLIILATQDSSIFTSKKFNNWNVLSRTLDTFPEVDFTVSIGDIKKLKKDTKKKQFVVESLYKKEPTNDVDVLKIKDELFNNLPFFDNFLFNKTTGTIRTVIYLKKDIVNTSIRKDFIFNVLNPTVVAFEKENNIDVKVSGMPYIRTMNSQNIIDEIGVFLVLALAITSIIFFLFFRSYRATFITMLVVSIGVIWAFGFIG